MLKKLRIGTILVLVLTIFLFYITENSKFLISMMIMIFIDTILDVYVTIKEKKYKTYKGIAITNLIVGVTCTWIIMIGFLGIQELDTVIGRDYPRYTFISSLVFFIVSLFRSYLKSERFKFKEEL